MKTLYIVRGLPGSGNKYSISAKKNVDDEFDKLFSDTSESDVPTEEDDLPF